MQKPTHLRVPTIRSSARSFRKQPCKKCLETWGFGWIRAAYEPLDSQCVRRELVRKSGSKCLEDLDPLNPGQPSPAVSLRPGESIVSHAHGVYWICTCVIFTGQFAPVICTEAWRSLQLSVPSSTSVPHPFIPSSRSRWVDGPINNQEKP
ncbi:hypothetical protein L209DRAFT_358727 [Thermothelomyces heterothallicus CBS 203.75]